MFTENFKGVSMKFRGCFKEVFGKFYGGFKKVSRVLKLRLNGVSRNLKGVSSLNGVSGKFQWCFR